MGTSCRSIFHDRYRELTQNFVSAMPTNPMDYLSTNDVPFLREMRASAWSTDRKSILSEAFMIGSISPPHSFWQQISSCMLDCANPSTPLPSSFTVHVLKGCCDDVLGRAALEYEACLMGGRDGEFLCLLGKDCARTGRKIYRITGLGFSDGRDEDDTIADSDIYWHVVFKAVGSTTGADLYQPASQWLNVELTMVIMPSHVQCVCEVTNLANTLQILGTYI